MSIHYSQDSQERVRLSLTPLYHFQPLDWLLGICEEIPAESSPLHMAISWTLTGNLWLPRASC